MLSSESYATILGLKKRVPNDPECPVIVFVGIRLNIGTSTDLYKRHGARQILLSAEDLLTVNSDMASVFVFTNHSFQQPETITDLWRVAREGSFVFVLKGMKNGVVEVKADIDNPTEYGLEFYAPGVHSATWPYSQGVIRKDIAKHFRS
jgi:hypothetical protein